MKLLERLDHRCLGAVEFVDAITGTRIREPLKLQSERLRLRANASALYAIHWAQGLEPHLEVFEQINSRVQQYELKMNPLLCEGPVRYQ